MRKQHIKKTNTNGVLPKRKLLKKLLVTTGLLLGFNYGAVAQNTAYGTDALKNISTGKSNAAFGFRTLFSNTTGGSNVANGDYALEKNIGGDENVANGVYAITSNTSGYGNTATGMYVMFMNTTGFENTANGINALRNNTIGSNNTALGAYADVGVNNLTNATAIGAKAKVMTSNTIQLGDNAVTKILVGVGNSATVIAGGLQITGGTPGIGKVLTSDATGIATWQTPMSSGTSWGLTGTAGTVDGTNFIGTTDNIPFNIRVNNEKAGRIDANLQNTFYGYKSGSANTTGSSNTVMGYKALSINTTGQWNTAIGSEAMLANTSGYFNTANGYKVLMANTTGYNNTASGYIALYKNTIGAGNTANGYEALGNNVSGSFNTAIGSGADVGSNNLTNATAIGAKAKVITSNTIQLGDNAVTQIYAGVGNTTTVVAGGLQITGGTPAAGKVLTSDATGVATWQNPMGGGTGWSLTGNLGTVDGTNFIGTTDNIPFNIRVNNQKAGRIDVNNAFYGYQSGNARTTGGFNTANGYQALYANTTGDGNTAIGDRSLLANTIGNYNTAIGSLALNSNIDGKYNTAIGYTADVQKGFNNSTAIGNNTIVNASDKIRLGDAGVKIIEGTVMYTVSDGRFKTNINEEEVKGLAFIQKLRPVVYNFDTKKFQAFLTQNMPADVRKEYMNKDFSASTAIRQSGFIAQEVEKAAQEVGYNFNGVHKPESTNDNYSLAYSQFVVPLVKGMQEQQQQIEEQKQEIKDQQKVNQQLQQQIDELKKLIVGNSSLTKDVATKEVGTANAEDINLYPNPTTGIFTITASHIDNGVIEIYDMAGNSMQKTTFNNAKAGYQLNVSGYAKGVYLLNIIANNKKYTKKLVIQ